MISRIEIQFAIEVELSDEEIQWLDRFVQRIAKRHEPEGMVHWASGCGSKPHFSAVDCGLLGLPPDPDGPANGQEPTFDHDVLYFETTCRESWPEEEERKREKARRKAERERSLRFRLRRYLHRFLMRIAEAV